MNDRKEVNIAIRLASMLIDHIIMTFILIAPFIPLIIVEIKSAFVVSHEEVKPDLSLFFSLFAVAFSLYFNKDFFGGRSLAKRLLKFQILVHRNDEVAGPIRCLIRNLTIIIWPVEIILSIINPNRRLGDYIAGTRLEVYDSAAHSGKKSFISILSSIFIVLVFTYMLELLFSKWKNSWSEEEVYYVAESFNQKESKELSSLLSNKFRYYCDSTDVRVYDKTKSGDLKYVSVLFYSKSPYSLENFELQKLKNKLKDTISLKFPPETYMLKGKIIYRSLRELKVHYVYYDPNDKTEKRDNTETNNDSTFTTRSFYKNGAQQSEFIYVNGKPEGLCKEWYDNGRIKTEIEYKNGKRNGITTTYFRNGQKEAEMLYEDNFFVKDIGRWDEDGNIVEDETQNQNSY